MEALIRDLDERREKIDTEIERREQVEAELARQFSDMERRWTQIGLIGSLIGNYDKELTQAGLLLRDGAIANTVVAASRFAKHLVGEVIDQLTDLKATIDSGQSNLAAGAEDALRTMRARAPAREGTLTTLQPFANDCFLDRRLDFSDRLLSFAPPGLL